MGSLQILLFGCEFQNSLSPLHLVVTPFLCALSAPATPCASRFLDPSSKLAFLPSFPGIPSTWNAFSFFASSFRAQCRCSLPCYIPATPPLPQVIQIVHSCSLRPFLGALFLLSWLQHLSRFTLDGPVDPPFPRCPRSSKGITESRI